MDPPDLRPRAPTDPTPPRWWLLLLPLLASAATRGWWAPDEPRYAQVAREVFEGGDFLAMHLCGELYPDKPPLLFWSAGLLGRLSGWNELAMRSVSLAATTATALLVLSLGRRLWGRLEGALGAALFLGTAMVTEIGGRLQIDPLLAFLATAALWLLLREAPSARAAGRDVLGAGLCVGLGILAKGPVAGVLVGLPALAWRFCVGRVARGGARSSRAARVGAVLLALALPLAWAVPAMVREPALFDQLLFEQHVGKAVDGSRHPGAPWKHLWRMPVFLLPWTLPCVVGLLAAFPAWRIERARRGATARGEAAPAGGSRDEGLVRVGAWWAVLLVFFSLLVSKRDLYLLSAYPAAALAGARVLALAARGVAPLPGRGGRRALRLVAWSPWVGVASFALAGLAAVGAALASGFVEAAGALAAEAPRVALAGGVLLVAAWWLAQVARGEELLVGVRALVASQGVAVALAFALVFPPLDGLKSARGFAERIAARPERPAAIPCVGVHPEGYRFYGGVPTVPIEPEELEEALARGGRDFLALVRERDWERKLAPSLRAQLAVVDEQRVGSRVVLLVARAAPAPRGSAASEGPPQPPPASVLRPAESDG